MTEYDAAAVSRWLDQWQTKTEAAAAIGVSRPTLNKMLGEGASLTQTLAMMMAAQIKEQTMTHRDTRPKEEAMKWDDRYKTEGAGWSAALAWTSAKRKTNLIVKQGSKTQYVDMGRGYPDALMARAEEWMRNNLGLDESEAAEEDSPKDDLPWVERHDRWEGRVDAALRRRKEILRGLKDHPSADAPSPRPSTILSGRPALGGPHFRVAECGPWVVRAEKEQRSWYEHAEAAQELRELQEVIDSEAPRPTEEEREDLRAEEKRRGQRKARFADDPECAPDHWGMW